MSKSTRPAPGTIAAEAAELREVIREGHALLKDLRAATAEARTLIAKLAREQVGEAVAAEVAAHVEAVGQHLTSSAANAITVAEGRIARRFAEMEEMLIGVGKTAPEALQHAIRTAIALRDPGNAASKRRLDALAELAAALPIVQAASGDELTLPAFDRPAGGTR